MIRHVLWFARPTIIVIGCYMASVGVSFLLSQRRVDQLDQRLAEALDAAGNLTAIRFPHPELDPKQVVEIQTAALADPDRKNGTLRCMNFASPDNLAITGPLEKFAIIIRSAKFTCLSAPDLVTVGEPIYRNGHARVLVSVLSGGQISAFAWVLEKQKDGQHQNCWMTDGVFAIDPSSENPNEV